MFCSLVLPSISIIKLTFWSQFVQKYEILSSSTAWGLRPETHHEGLIIWEIIGKPHCKTGTFLKHYLRLPSEKHHYIVHCREYWMIYRVPGFLTIVCSNVNDIKTDCREFWMIDRAPGFHSIICSNVNDIKTKRKKRSFNLGKFFMSKRNNPFLIQNLKKNKKNLKRSSEVNSSYSRNNKDQSEANSAYPTH